MSFLDWPGAMLCLYVCKRLGQLLVHHTDFISVLDEQRAAVALADPTRFARSRADLPQTAVYHRPGVLQ